jgi:hypothetical protein
MPTADAENSLLDLDLPRNLGIDLGLFLLGREVGSVPIPPFLPGNIDPPILGVPFDDDRLGYVVQQPPDRFEAIRGRRLFSKCEFELRPPTLSTGVRRTDQTRSFPPSATTS